MKLSNKEYKALEAVWDKKLADSGFKDIEQRDGYLKQWSSHFALQRHHSVTEAITEYYIEAGKFLHDYEFNSRFEKVVWELHSDGKTIKEIVAIMKSRRFKVYKRKAHETIQFLAKEMMKRCQTRHVAP